MRIGFFRLLSVLLLLTLPAVAQAQFIYWTNNSEITIAGYNGSGGAVTIPSTINGLPVTSIGTYAFSSSTNVTSVTIPNSVTSIGDYAIYGCAKLNGVTIGNSVTNIGHLAFGFCTNLTSVTIPDNVTSIGSYAFDHCTSLTNVTISNSITSITSIGDFAFFFCKSLTSVTIPTSVTSIGTYAFDHCPGLSTITVDALNSFYGSLDGVLFNKSQTTLIKYPEGKTGSYTIPDNVTRIGSYAFYSCASLTSVTIGNSVTSIADYAFSGASSLTGVYFQGNAPSLGSPVFDYDYNATVYYLPGTTGWGPTFGGRPTVLWNPLLKTSDASFGVQTNQFGFTITGSSNLVIVVEACSNLANPIWSPVGTNALTGGSFYFSDPQWTNYPGRFYRLRSF